jgi:hypothetical protein
MMISNLNNKIKHGKKNESQCKTKPIPILPPSPKNNVPNVTPDDVELTEHVRPEPTRTRIQHSNAIFDPNNASPASDFINMLKLRMNVYYEHDLDMFVKSTR